MRSGAQRGAGSRLVLGARRPGAIVERQRDEIVEHIHVPYVRPIAREPGVKPVEERAVYLVIAADALGEVGRFRDPRS